MEANQPMGKGGPGNDAAVMAFCCFFNSICRRIVRCRRVKEEKIRNSFNSAKL